MGTRDEYIAVMKQAFVSLGKKVVVEFITTNFPFLAKAYISPFISFGVGLGIEALAKHAEMGLFFYFIDMRVGQQGKDFERAAYDNFKAQKGEPWEKANAEKNLRAALRNLAVFTN